MSGSNIKIACPKCKAECNLRGRAMTLALVCPSCQTYFRTGAWDSGTKHFEGAEAKPAIAIGTKGEIEGYVYEVMGFIVKQERKYRYRWREYLLFNPFRGYAFLSEYNGHWNFVWPLEQGPSIEKVSAEPVYEGDVYKLYQKYNADVVFAQGEFFFDVLDMTDNTRNYEYICPPYVLTLEKSHDSLLWCKGEYFTRNEIAEIFPSAKASLPKKVGMGYTEPVGGKFSRTSLIQMTILMIVAAVVIQFYFSSSAQEKVVYHNRFTESELGGEKMFATTPFKLADGTKSLHFYIDADLSNDWFYGEFTLVNEATGEEVNFSKDIEYYHGYEDGSSWSEGSKAGDAYISRVAEGTYHINIYPQFSPTSKSFRIIVTRDVPNSSNLVFTILMLLVYPAFHLIRGHYREVKRWSESDYSPYDS